MPHGPYVSRATELPIAVLDPSDADDPPVHGCRMGVGVIKKSLDSGGMGLTELCWAAATAASASKAAAVAARIFF